MSKVESKYFALFLQKCIQNDNATFINTANKMNFHSQFTCSLAYTFYIKKWDSLTPSSLLVDIVFTEPYLLA